MSRNAESLENYEKRKEIAELGQLIEHAKDFCRWGSWTNASDLLKQAGEKALAIRKREVESAVRQEELALHGVANSQAELFRG